MTFAHKVDETIRAHRSAGRVFACEGVKSFVRDEGSGVPVILVHGLPMSSFLYRKLIPLLAAQGLRGVAFDLPGLGLADRPADFDYTLAGLGRYSAEAVDTLGLDRFHLVVHDAGGPIGFELAKLRPRRVLSLTILNTTLAIKRVPFPARSTPTSRTRFGAPWGPSVRGGTCSMWWGCLIRTPCPMSMSMPIVDSRWARTPEPAT